MATCQYYIKKTNNPRICCKNAPQSSSSFFCDRDRPVSDVHLDSRIYLDSRIHLCNQHFKTVQTQIVNTISHVEFKNCFTNNYFKNMSVRNFNQIVGDWDEYQIAQMISLLQFKKDEFYQVSQQQNILSTFQKEEQKSDVQIKIDDFLKKHALLHTRELRLRNIIQLFDFLTSLEASVFICRHANFGYIVAKKLFELTSEGLCPKVADHYFREIFEKRVSQLQYPLPLASINQIRVLITQQREEQKSDVPKKNCPICLDDFSPKKMTFLQCAHALCNGCLRKLQNCNIVAQKCPICRYNIKKTKNQIKNKKTKNKIKKKKNKKSNKK